MKILLIIFFLASFPCFVSGQIISNYGLKSGVGISNVTWNNDSGLDVKWKTKSGFSPRLFANFFNIPFFQLEAEISYLRKGFKEKIPYTTTLQPDGTGEYMEINAGLDYLSLSALGKFKYAIGLFSPYIIVGPQLNFLLSKSFNKEFGDIFDKFYSSNIGLSVGGGFELNKILPVSILLEYRYEWDLGNNYNSSDLYIKNYSHVILIGIKI